jgi:hypothetical protein
MENALVALVAGTAIAFLGYAYRPRPAGQRLTNDQRVATMGWVFVAWFFIFVLQQAGVGREFAIASGAAALLILIYLLVRRLARKPAS